MKDITKKILIGILIITIGCIYTIFPQKVIAEMNPFGGSSIYNTEQNNAVNGSGLDSNPIRNGAFKISNGIIGIVQANTEITEHSTALNKTLSVVQNIVNYALGLIGLIALIYILYQGFVVLTAGGDDSKQKKGFKGIKNAFIAMAGVALSWIIVSFLLRLINTLAV